MDLADQPQTARKLSVAKGEMINKKKAEYSYALPRLY